MPSFPSSQSLLFVIKSFYFISVYILTTVFAVDERYTSCNTLFDCANIKDIGYPFWGSTRPEYCGHPGFNLNCSGTTPEITISDQSFRVLEIINMSKVIRAVRTEYADTICPLSPVNTTLDLKIFQYATTNDQNITLYYDCPAVTNQSLPQSVGRFNCSDAVNYYATKNLSSDPSMGSDLSSALRLCKDSVVISVVASQVQFLEDDPGSVIGYGFGIRWSANDSLCDQCKWSGGQCGQNQSSGDFICYCSDQPHESNCLTGGVSPVSSSKHGLQRKDVIGLSTGLAAFVVISVGVICWLKIVNHSWNKYGKLDRNVEAFIKKNGSLAPKRYSRLALKKMTNSFSDTVGKGGFGTVYRGKLPDGRLVAVKVLNESNGTNPENFINEVASMTRTSHVNIVSLLGFCYERNNRALIYEFIPNGSLDKFICDERLEWVTLYKIAVGIARGLEYLHRGCNTRIVHFDIKPHNILLDRDFCPKISDFGLAKLWQKQGSSGTTMSTLLTARGTVGYIAPEVIFKNFGDVSHKSDVYSYGMMILEMVGGCRKKLDDDVSHSSEVYASHWIYNQLKEGEDLKLDEDLENEEDERTASKMIRVGLWCIQTHPSDRPSITKVLEMLEGSIEALDIPPKPFLFTPRESPVFMSAASSV